MLPKVYLIGNLSQEPTVAVTNNGIKYARISVACSPIKSTNNPNPQTNFFNMTVWRQTASFVESYVHKGDGVFVEGKLATRSYTKTSGEVVFTTEIIVDQLQVTNSRSRQNNGSMSYNNNSYNSYNNEMPKMDFPDIKPTVSPESIDIPVAIDDDQIMTKTKMNFKAETVFNEIPNITTDDEDDDYFDDIFEKKN